MAHNVRNVDQHFEILGGKIQRLINFNGVFCTLTQSFINRL